MGAVVSIGDDSSCLSQKRPHLTAFAVESCPDRAISRYRLVKGSLLMSSIGIAVALCKEKDVLLNQQHREKALLLHLLR
jgi:hypothetical protein